MGRVEPDDRLPLIAYSGQVLHREVNDLWPFFVEAGPDFILHGQNDREFLTPSLSATSWHRGTFWLEGQNTGTEHATPTRIAHEPPR